MIQFFKRYIQNHNKQDNGAIREFQILFSILAYMVSDVYFRFFMLLKTDILSNNLLCRLPLAALYVPQVSVVRHNYNRSTLSFKTIKIINRRYGNFN